MHEVESALLGLQLTAPGPPIIDHAMVSAPGGLGRPSSVAVPTRLAAAGRAMVWSAPAFTTGAWLVGDAGLTVTLMSSVAVRALSLAVRRRT